MVSILNEQRNFLEENRINLGRFCGNGKWHRCHCPKCGHEKRKNLSIGIFSDGGIYGRCHRCFSEFKKPSSQYRAGSGKKGLDLTTCQSLGLKSLAQVGGIDKVAQPYIRENKVYAYKIRPVIGKGDHFWIGGEGKGQYFFNEDALRRYKDDPLIITEGEFDAICLIGCGYRRVVSVPNGANEKSIPLDDPSYNTAFPYLECHEPFNRIKHSIHHHLHRWR